MAQAIRNSNAGSAGANSIAARIAALNSEPLTKTEEKDVEFQDASEQSSSTDTPSTPVTDLGDLNATIDPASRTTSEVEETTGGDLEKTSSIDSADALINDIRSAKRAQDAKRAKETDTDKAKAAREAKERGRKAQQARAERLAKAKADREAQEQAEREAQESAAKEQAEREAQEIAAREQAEREAQELAERQAQELAAKEQAEREAQELATRQEAEREAQEIAARQETERQAQEQAEREAQEIAAREQAEKEAKEQAEREAQELAARQQAEREAQELAARQQAEREAQEEEARLQAEREAQAEAARLQAEQEAQELAARQQAEREAQELVARQQAEREAQEEVARLESEKEARELAAEQQAEKDAQELAAKQQAEREAQELLASQASTLSSPTVPNSRPRKDTNTASIPDIVPPPELPDSPQTSHNTMSKVNSPKVVTNFNNSVHSTPSKHPFSPIALSKPQMELPSSPKSDHSSSNSETFASPVSSVPGKKSQEIQEESDAKVGVPVGDLFMTSPTKHSSQLSANNIGSNVSSKRVSSGLQLGSIAAVPTTNNDDNAVGIPVGNLTRGNSIRKSSLAALSKGQNQTPTDSPLIPTNKTPRTQLSAFVDHSPNSGATRIASLSSIPKGESRLGDSLNKKPFPGDEDSAAMNRSNSVSSSRMGSRSRAMSEVNTEGLSKNADVNLIANRFKASNEHYASIDRKAQEFLDQGQNLLKDSYNNFLKTFNSIVKDGEKGKSSSGTKESAEDSNADWAFWTSVVNDYTAIASTEPEMLEEQITNGIPSKIRGIIWQLIANSKSQEFEDIYKTLSVAETPNEASIRRDIKRTNFVNDVQAESLYKVLKVYSIYDPDVGYMQGMAFIAAPLILNCASEAEAFGLYVRLMKSYGLREFFLPNMEGLMVMLYQFDRLIEENAPMLYNHLAREGIRSTMYATQWFLTFFGYKFPLGFVLRIFDIVLVEGVEVILKFAVILMLKNKDTLTKLKFDQLLEFLKENLFDFYLKDSGKNIDNNNNTNESVGNKKSGNTMVIDINNYNIDQFVNEAITEVTITPISLDRYKAEYAEIHQVERQKEEQYEGERIKNKQLQLEVKKLERDCTALNREYVTIANELINHRLNTETMADENRELKNTVEKLKKQLKEAKEKAEIPPKVETEIPIDLKEDLERTMERNAEVMNENMALQDRVDALESQVEKLLKERDSSTNNNNNNTTASSSPKKSKEPPKIFHPLESMLGIKEVTSPVGSPPGTPKPKSKVEQELEIVAQRTQDAKKKKEEEQDSNNKEKGEVKIESESINTSINQSESVNETVASTVTNDKEKDKKKKKGKEESSSKALNFSDWTKKVFNPTKE